MFLWLQELVAGVTSDHLLKCEDSQSWSVAGPSPAKVKNKRGTFTKMVTFKSSEKVLLMSRFHWQSSM